MFVAAAAILAVLVTWRSSSVPLILLLPLFAGLVLPLFRPERLQAWIDGRADKIAERRARARSGTGTIDRWWRRPYYAGLAAIWSLTGRIRDNYLRAGLRMTLLVYFIWMALLVALAAIYAVMVVVVILLVLAFMLLILWFFLRAMLGGGSSSSWSWSGGGSTREEGNPYAETTVYKPGLFFDDPVLRIDSEGRILKPGTVFDEATGYRVKADGIYREGMVFDEKVAEIGGDGEVKLPGLISEPTGFRIRDGKILKEGIIFDEEIGKIKDDS
jgi:hypothetical protein